MTTVQEVQAAEDWLDEQFPHVAVKSTLEMNLELMIHNYGLTDEVRYELGRLAGRVLLGYDNLTVELAEETVEDFARLVHPGDPGMRAESDGFASVVQPWIDAQLTLNNQVTLNNQEA